MASCTPNRKSPSFATSPQAGNGHRRRTSGRRPSSKDGSEYLEASGNLGSGHLMERTMRYPVMIRRTATGYSVDVPDVLGCVATATSLESARELIARALEGHFEIMAAAGESIPQPSHSIEFTIDDDAGEEFCTWVEVDLNEAVSM